MKRTITVYHFLSFLFATCSFSFAQSGIVGSGGTSSGSSGTFSYSVGQLSYQTETDDGGSVLHGNQQSFEIFEGESMGLVGSKIELSVFPNPVVQELRIDFKGFIPENTVFRIANTEGRIVLEQPLEKQSTLLNLSGFRKGTYILLITDTKGEWMRSFKLVKTLE